MTSLNLKFGDFLVSFKNIIHKSYEQNLLVIQKYLNMYL